MYFKKNNMHPREAGKKERRKYLDKIGKNVTYRESGPGTEGPRTELSAAKADCGAAADEAPPTVLISGNCCRKLASRSSPGFCELVLQVKAPSVKYDSDRRRMNKCPF
jgi:hypothetical protein